VRESPPVHADACIFRAHELLICHSSLAPDATAEESRLLECVCKGRLDVERGWGLWESGFDRILEAFHCPLLEDIAGEEEEDCEGDYWWKVSDIV